MTKMGEPTPEMSEKKELKHTNLFCYHPVFLTHDARTRILLNVKFERISYLT